MDICEQIRPVQGLAVVQSLFFPKRGDTLGIDIPREQKIHLDTLLVKGERDTTLWQKEKDLGTGKTH